MIIIQQIQEQLQSLLLVLDNMNNTEYTHKSNFLSNASIGAHTRHIIELLDCVHQGYAIGIVDYFNRQRNHTLEHAISAAKEAIHQSMMATNKADKDLCLQMEDGSLVNTNYQRELVYQLEHIIHHLASIKVVLIELNIPLAQPYFGFAYATIQYQASKISA